MATRKQANKTWEELESIRQSLVDDIFPKIKQTKQELDRYQNELFVGSEENPAVQDKINKLYNKIVKLKEQAKEQAAAIQQLYKQVFQGNEEEAPFKKQVEDFLNESKQLFSDTETKKEDFDAFYRKVFGEENENGEIKGGLKKELEKYTAQYNTLFETIEGLLPGATSVGLVKVFEDKVREYKNAERLWVIAFLTVTSTLTIYFGIVTFGDSINQTFTNVTLSVLQKSPFLLFAIWMLVFIGNRRAESKKLEESYKHKEAMARAYVGYKEQIVELEDEDEKNLLKSHMQNLLAAINVNSGDFLNSEGDGHPFWDRFSRRTEKKTKKTTTSSDSKTLDTKSIDKQGI